MTVAPRSVITDLTVSIHPPSTCELRPTTWRRIEKDLYLHTWKKIIWLYIALVKEEELVAGDLFVTDIRVGEQPPDLGVDCLWESRPGAIWILRSKFSGETGQAMTDVDVLFGVDAVDPRPQWTLMQSPLLLNAPSKIPVARLSVFYGRAAPKRNSGKTLRVKKNGKFKIVQISDTHMGTGVGLCKDALDADGNRIPHCEADPHTVKLIGKILDSEKPDLVVLTGDQLHHDVPDSQSALFKVVAPIIERSIPFAAVFGNHDSEGLHALPRTAQMSILQNLPFSLCESGPEQVDGVGNYYLQILASAPSQRPISTLYLLDSHGQLPSKVANPDYEAIKQSQIDWFVSVSRAHRNARKQEDSDSHFYLSLAFLHIPLPEFGNCRLTIRSGRRREPTESPRFNSHLYDALAEEGISALGCGHDHVNDFCALLPQRIPQNSDKPLPIGPWLCYGGGSGFGGYCSYGGERFYRGARVWELDTTTESLKTWRRDEYASYRVDELVLVEGGVVVDNCGKNEEDGICC